MPKGFLPNKDSALLTWARNFAERVNAEASSLGVSVEQAARLVDAAAEWEAAYRVAIAPGTRTQPSVARKNECRETFKNEARRMARIIGGQVNVSDAQKLLLGLTVRKAYSRIPAPAGRPSVRVTNVRGRRIELHLHESGHEGRGLPKNVAGARVYVQIGEEPSANVDAWRFVCATSRATVTVDPGPAATPGSKVWLCACWVNPRQERGPMSNVAMTWVQFGGVEIGGAMMKAA